MSYISGQAPFFRNALYFRTEGVSRNVNTLFMNYFVMTSHQSVIEQYTHLLQETLNEPVGFSDGFVLGLAVGVCVGVAVGKPSKQYTRIRIIGILNHK